ncbi:MAG: NTP transferase domain-containing protein [FCB group bacterium]|nr:NTP transferase domain-containing protein [FCB group bacterium]
MKAIIPVAGQGTRLLPHTAYLQKCLLPVAGRPILEHILNPLLEIGVEEIVLIVGHLGEQVRVFAERFSNVKFTFIEQRERLGLGHAILQGLEHTAEPVIVILGDTIIQMDYRKFVSAGTNVIGVVEVPDPERFGIVLTEGDRIVGFLEKPENPPGNLAIGGIYFFSSQAVLRDSLKYLIDNNIKTGNEYQLTDGLQQMLISGQTFVFRKIANWLDCGLPETILKTNQFLLGESGASWVAGDAFISNSRLRNCHISSGCTVHDATLDNVILLQDSVVEGAQLSNLIVGVGETIRQLDNIGGQFAGSGAGLEKEIRTSREKDQVAGPGRKKG